MGDAEYRGDNAVGSEGVLTFGKYKGQSYEKTLQRDPEWCKWVLRASGNPHPGRDLLAFAEFLRSKRGFGLDAIGSRVDATTMTEHDKYCAAGVSLSARTE